jgi:hypothetical protein
MMHEKVAPYVEVIPCNDGIFKLDESFKLIVNTPVDSLPLNWICLSDVLSL